MKLAGYILAGGENRRMDGKKKLFLEYGGESFCRHILCAFHNQGFSEIYLSVEAQAPYEQTGLPLVVDAYPGAGPLGGLCTGLKMCPEEALFTVACDMPCINSKSVENMVRAFQQHGGVVVAQAGGRLQPLFAIYPKTVLPVLESMIQKKDYRMTELLAHVGYTAVLFSEDSIFQNINTPEEYRRLTKQPFVFAVSGFKNTGKTTLITRLVPELIRRGHQVAVIKHDGHDFTPDVPGTDSFRHQTAGAYGTAVYSKHRFMVTKPWTHEDVHFLIQMFPEADIILIEGLKNSSYPKYVCNYPQEALAEAPALADEIERLMEKNF